MRGNKAPNNLKANRINWLITAKKVFVIDEAGTKLGALSLNEAISLAESKGLDLVEVARNEFPPVCKLMDYGKHCFVSKKNQSKSKRENKVREKKEIQVRPNIEEHDFQVKLKHLAEFLKDGFKVNIILKFKGRQIVHPSIGMNLLKRFANEVKDFSKVETQPQIEGRRASMLIGPTAIGPFKSDKSEQSDNQKGSQDQEQPVIEVVATPNT